MLEMLRPRLRGSVVTRRRADRSWGLADPLTGRALEIAADQDALVGLVDGRRSVAELADAHLQLHRFVPFAALRDFLRSLSGDGFLANERIELEGAHLPTRPNWMVRHGHVSLTSLPVPASRATGAAALLLVAALALLGGRATPVAFSPWDVPLALAGAALALTLRSWAKAGVAALAGQPPSRLHLALGFGVPHLSLDATRAALLDRLPRAAAHTAALLGAAAAIAAGAAFPGLRFGALVVLLADLCPFAPTSFGKLLATLAGRVDLREHARAYLSRRLFRRMTSTRFFAGETSLIISALLSLAWLGLIVRLLLTRGVVLIIQLLALGVDAGPLPRALAYAGAGAVALAIPVALFALGAALVRAIVSLLPAARARRGKQVRGTLETKDLADIPLFSKVPDAELAQIAGAAQEVQFRPGEAIVVQGGPGDAFFAIRSGEVAVLQEDDSGLSRDVAHLGPGDCFGELALLERRPRSATVRALRPTVVLRLSTDAFDRVRQRAPGADITSLLRATAALHHSAVFGNLPPERLSTLATKLRPRAVQLGEAVVREGEAGHEFFLVGAGALEVLGAGGERLDRLGPGDHFGEIALLRDVPRTATVRALEPSTVLVLDQRAFVAALASDLSLSVRVEELAGRRAEGHA